MVLITIKNIPKGSSVGIADDNGRLIHHTKISGKWIYDEEYTSIQFNVKEYNWYYLIIRNVYFYPFRMQFNVNDTPVQLTTISCKDPYYNYTKRQREELKLKDLLL